MNLFSTMPTASGLNSPSKRPAITPRAEAYSFIVRLLTMVALFALLVFVAGIVTKRNLELSSLRSELQRMDQQKREKEKILVNLNMELSRLKDGANITTKARELGLRPATPTQMRFHSQMARAPQGFPRKANSKSVTSSRQGW